MAKIVYNACFGGFTLSRAAIIRAREISGDPKWGGACIKGDAATWGVIDHDFGQIENIPRHDATLVAVVEELGDLASGDCAELRIEEVKSGTPYRIDEYDGRESVMTCSDYEWTVAP